MYIGESVELKGYIYTTSTVQFHSHSIKTFTSCLMCTNREQNTRDWIQGWIWHSPCLQEIYRMGEGRESKWEFISRSEFIIIPYLNSKYTRYLLKKKKKISTTNSKWHSSWLIPSMTWFYSLVGPKTVMPDKQYHYYMSN